MSPHKNGFSLIELLVALSVTMVVAAMLFHMFHQNERVIRDQTLIMEMQQTARIVASQIADEIRMAGQGVPVYASTFDLAPSEAVALIFGSANAGRIDFRAGLSNVETSATDPVPLTLTVGLSRSVGVVSGSGAGFAPGRFVYISGPCANAGWCWVRAELTAVASASLTVIARDTGATDANVLFTGRPAISLEEANSIYLNSGSVRRATASSTSNPAVPSWGAANEVGKNVSSLRFTYFDGAGNAIQPSSLANRLSIVRVNIEVTVEAAAPLSNGIRPNYSISVGTIPRNALRW